MQFKVRTSFFLTWQETVIFSILYIFSNIVYFSSSHQMLCHAVVETDFDVFSYVVHQLTTVNGGIADTLTVRPMQHSASDDWLLL
jgi:hypothetical protein